MEAFQLRLWDGRIGRWLSPDPYGQYASPYLGMGNNPIGMIDRDGGKADDIIYLDQGGKEIYRIAQAGPDVFYQETYPLPMHSGANVGSFELTIPRNTNYVNPSMISSKPLTILDNYAYSENILKKGAYDLIDQPFVAFQSLNPFDQRLQHLNGDGVSPKEKLESGVLTLVSLAPAPTSEISLLKPLNASKFSQLFKGTFAKLAPGTRGVLNRNLNVAIKKATNEAFILNTSLDLSGKIYDNKKNNP